MRSRAIVRSVAVTLWMVAMGSGLAMATTPGMPDPLKDPLQLLKVLEEKRVALDARSKALDQREAELKRLEETIDKRLAAMNSLRALILKDFEREKAVDDANIKRLAKIYTGMKPKQAAAQFTNLDQSTAIRVLKVMREKVAAKILGKMDPQYAASLTEVLGIPISQRRRSQ
ncbi:MAG: hypothetical protein HQL53_02895 [Magnetococcales bacterium]|nr:hypothetical protein [Magnetococcales bacterium]